MNDHHRQSLRVVALRENLLRDPVQLDAGLLRSLRSEDHVATVRNAEGEERPFDLWTTCFTPRELTLLAERHGVEVQSVSGVTPGAYGNAPPTLDDPELLIIGRRTR